MVVSLFREESYGTDAGQLVRYIWDPLVTVHLSADREMMPKEDWTLFCDPISRKVEDIFGPAFLALHNDETIPPQPGGEAGPAVLLSDFSVQSGMVLANTQYLRTRPLQNGGEVSENTYITILHKP